MLMQAESVFHAMPRRAPRTLMVIGRETDDRVLEAVADVGGYDVIVVETPTTAYSRVKRVAPSLVVLCMTGEDVEACQVMSMLQLDRETAEIPVVTCLLEPMPAHSDV